MAHKCIAIGNTLMGDDGIGVYILKQIEKDLNKLNIDTLYGETDSFYITQNIKNDDLLYILDATNFHIPVGSLTLTPLNKIFESNKAPHYQHDFTIFHGIKLYNINVSGYLIGIEGKSFDFSTEISNELRFEINGICKEILNFIEFISENTTT